MRSKKISDRITAEDIRNISLSSYVEPLIAKHFSRMQRPIYGTYSSAVGEFHRIGNLEEQGFELPAVKSFDGCWPSIKPIGWKPTVYTRGPAHNLYPGFD